MEKNIERKMKKIERDMINYYLDDDKPEERKGYTPRNCHINHLARSGALRGLLAFP